MSTVIISGVVCFVIGGLTGAVTLFFVYRNNRDDFAEAGERVDEFVDDVGDTLEQAQQSIRSFYKNLEGNVRRASKKRLQEVIDEANMILNSTRNQGVDLLNKAEKVLDRAEAALKDIKG